MFPKRNESRYLNVIRLVRNLIFMFILNIEAYKIVLRLQGRGWQMLHKGGKKEGRMQQVYLQRCLQLPSH